MKKVYAEGFGRFESSTRAGTNADGFHLRVCWRDRALAYSVTYSQEHGFLHPSHEIG